MVRRAKKSLCGQGKTYPRQPHICPIKVGIKNISHAPEPIGQVLSDNNKANLYRKWANFAERSRSKAGVNGSLAELEQTRRAYISEQTT